MRHVRFIVDPETRKVVEQWAGFINVDPSRQQFQGLYFSTVGWVGETSVIPTEKGQIIQVSITGTNRSHFHATVHEEYDSDTAFTSRLKSVMYDGNYMEEGEVRRFQRVSQTFGELIEGGAIDFGDTPEPIQALTPLSRLAGRWRSVGDGTTDYRLNWNLRMEGKWLIERWQTGGESGSGGFNVTGIDSATRMLALWSISQDFIGKNGRWDVLSDNVLGQVQGNARLIREFSDDETFKAHWQLLTAGSYVNVPADQAERYTVKRVVREN